MNIQLFIIQILSLVQFYLRRYEILKLPLAKREEVFGFGYLPRKIGLTVKK